MDLLRGFAVLGIFQINIYYFGMPHELYNSPTLNGNHDLFNTLSWFFTTLLVDGSMYGLFSLLFGASAMLYLDRASADETLLRVDHYYRRMLWLVLFGLIHAYLLLSPLEILFTYGVLGMFLFPLRNLSPAVLLLAGGTLLVLGVFDFVIINDAEAAIAMEDRETIYQLILSQYEVFRSGYGVIFLDNFEKAQSWQSVNFIEDQIYDSGGFMLVGMALYRLRVVTGEQRIRFYLLLSLSGYLIALLLRWPTAIILQQSDFDPVVFNQLPTGIMLLGRIFLVFGHLGLLIALYRMRLLRRLFFALQQTGRMALTNYITQTLFATTLFYSFGLGMYGRYERYELLSIAILFTLLQVAASIAWLHYYRLGPLEWLWRSLVRLQPEPLRLQST